MIVYIIALLDALTYLSAVPICAAFFMHTGEKPVFGAGLGAFRSKGALRRARRKPRRTKKGALDISGLPRLLRVLGHLRPDELVLRGRLGLGDAAATATVCGALTALTQVLGVRAGRSRIDIAPDFDDQALRVELEGMIRARAGQIIVAAMRGELTIARERIAQWTGTRLKASWPPPWRTSAT